MYFRPPDAESKSASNESIFKPNGLYLSVLRWEYYAALSTCLFGRKKKQSAPYVSHMAVKCNFKESYQYSIHLASSRSVLSWFQQVWQQPKAQQYQRFWWEQQAWNHQAWLIITCSSSFMYSVSEKSYGSGWLNHCSSSTRISASWGSRLSALVLTTLIKWARLASSGDLKLSQSWSKDFQSNCESIHA